MSHEDSKAQEVTVLPRVGSEAVPVRARMLGSLSCLLPAPCTVQQPVSCGQGPPGAPLRAWQCLRGNVTGSSEPGPARPSLDPPPPAAPLLGPRLIRLSGQTVVHSPAQHSPGGRMGQASACLCAVWPAWGWAKGGGARGSPGRWGQTPGRCPGALHRPQVTGAAHLLQVPPRPAYPPPPPAQRQ